MKPLMHSHIPGLPLSFRGKVRDVYGLGDRMLIVATDRISAFDLVLPTPIPGKGRILTALSNFWFRKTAGIVANHLVDMSPRELIPDATIDTLAELDGRAVVARRAEPLKIKAIVRGYLAGSGWADYERTGAICGIRLPAGLRVSERLPEAIFTPSTKAPAGSQDENIPFDRVVEQLGPGLAEAVRQLSLALYREASAWAECSGIILADTKLEFGFSDGQLILIDELLTPDSSRFWDADGYEPGRPQPSFDKQYVRDYLIATGWNRQAPAPELPPDVVEQTLSRYREALVRLTGGGKRKSP